MTFQNVAYLFDSSILGRDFNCSTRGVLSFVGNSLYLSTYAKDIVEKLDFSDFDGVDFSDWAHSSQNSETFAQFLIKLCDDAGKLGLISFFIEKDYASFLYLLGLMTTSVKVDDPNFRIYLDKLYQGYKSQYQDEIEREDLDKTVTEFNQRILHLLQTQKEHHFFNALFSEHRRELKEQTSILHQIEKEMNSGFMLADSFFYGQQLLKTYRDKEVCEIFSTPRAAQQLQVVAERTNRLKEIEIKTTVGFEGESEYIEKLARLLLRLCHYIIEKVISAKDMDNISEEDKYMFVIVWMILQSGDNNMFVNKRSYDIINEVFMSLKKDMNV